jgi:hypothetical protein
LQTEGRLSSEAAAALLPAESAQRQVAAKLALGGWPLGGASDDNADDAPPREGSPLGGIVAWLREGYPGGVPDHDYVPLLALLERRLTRSEVKQVAKALRRADVSPAGPADIAAAISDYTHTTASEDDLRGCASSWPRRAGPWSSPTPTSPDPAPANSKRNARPASLTDGRFGLYAAWLGLHPQPPCGARPLARGAQAAQALDEHRVVGESRRVVDEPVEHLVVARRAHLEQVTDGGLLGARVFPPLPLEGEDLAIAVAEVADGAGRLGCRGGGVHRRSS